MEVIIFIFIIFCICILVWIIDWWTDGYHNEKFCPRCGCELEAAWYGRNKSFDTKTGVGWISQYQLAVCPKQTVHFRKRTGKNRSVPAIPACK